MATTPKPSFKPEWATVIAAYGGKVNALQPAAGLLPEGDQYGLPPVRNHHNWLWHYVGEWVDYLEAYTDAAQKCATKTVAAEDSSDAWKQTADYVVGVGLDAGAVFATAIAAMGANGGLIILSEGTFSMETAISVTAKTVAIRGQGKHATFLDMPDGADRGIAGVLNKTFNISDLSISGTNLNGWIFNGISVIGAAGNAYATIENVRFTGLPGGPSPNTATPQGCAIHAAGTAFVKVINCERQHFVDVPSATYAGESVIGAPGAVVEVDGFTLTNPLADAASTAPAFLFEDCRFTIDRIDISAPMSDGIQVLSGNDWTIGKAYVDSPTANGIDVGTVGACLRVSVEDFSVNTPGGYGALIQQVTGGTISIRSVGAGLDGLQMITCDNITIQCDANGSTAKGIDLSGSTDIRLLEPYTTGNPIGIYMDGTCVDCSVVGGKSMSDDEGIRFLGDNCTATGHKVDDCQLAGGFAYGLVGATGTQINGCSIRNLVAAGANVAIDIDATSHGTKVNGGLIETITGTGIVMRGERCTVDDVTINAVTAHSIQVTSTALNFKIDGCHFSGAGAGNSYIYIDPAAVGGFAGRVSDNDGDDGSASKPATGIDLRTNGGILNTYVLIQNNWLRNVATVDLQVQGAFNLAQSLPAADVGATVAFTVVENNYVLTSGNA
jgi:hypothetical protein